MQTVSQSLQLTHFFSSTTAILKNSGWSWRGCMEMQSKGQISTQNSKAKVDAETCTACEFCVDICPFDCISMQPRHDHPEFFKIAVVDEKKCVSCKLCETVCIKESISVERPAPNLAHAPNR